MRWDRGNFLQTLQVDVEGKSEVWHSWKSRYETGEREHYAALHIEVDCKPQSDPVISCYFVNGIEF